MADILNRVVAYRIFSASDAFFDEQMLDNLRGCLQKLYDRDKRLNLYPKDFWIVDKSMAARIDQLNLDSLVKSVNLTLLQNAPQTIPFEVRANFFKRIIQAERE